MQQQLPLYLIICFYFNYSSTLTQLLKMQYFTYILLQSSKMDKMGNPVVSAVAKWYFLKFLRGRTSSKKVSLPVEINLLRNIFVVDKIKFFTYFLLQNSKMNSMSYLLVSAVTKQYYLKFYRSGTPLKEVLFPVKINLLRNIFVVKNMKYFIYCQKSHNWKS